MNYIKLSFPIIVVSHIRMPWTSKFSRLFKDNKVTLKLEKNLKKTTYIRMKVTKDPLKYLHDIGLGDYHNSYLSKHIPKILETFSIKPGASQLQIL